MNEFKNKYPELYELGKYIILPLAGMIAIAVLLGWLL